MSNPNSYLPLQVANLNESLYQKEYGNDYSLDFTTEVAFDVDETEEDMYNYYISMPGTDEEEFEKSYGMTLREAVKKACQKKRQMTQLVIIKLWSQNKQAYQFDPDFLDELMETENIVFSKEVVEHLPYSNFYLDFSLNRKAKELLGADGIYVSAIPTQVEKNRLFCVTITPNHITQRIQTELVPIAFEQVDENHTLSKEEWLRTCTHIDCNFNEIKNADDQPTISQEGTFLLLQAITYLATEKADIRKNPKQNIIYREPKKGAKVKNIPAELQKWDVGAKYGSEFRKWKANKEYEKGTGTGTGSSKRPHMRRAHYHGFYYNDGNGGKELRYRWLHPIMVGTGDPTATIHKVKG